MTTEPSYVPVVASLEDVTPIPGADRIVSATARGYRLVVGVDRKVGELGVVFPAEGVLDLEFAIAAGLLVRHPRTAEKLGGYLDDPPRIRNLVLRGVRTDALWIPLADFRAAVERAVRVSSRYMALANQPAEPLSIVSLGARSSSSSSGSSSGSGSQDGGANGGEDLGVGSSAGAGGNSVNVGNGSESSGSANSGSEGGTNSGGNG